MLTPLWAQHFQVVSTIRHVIRAASTDKIAGIVVIRENLLGAPSRIGSEDVNVGITIDTKAHFNRIVDMITILVDLNTGTQRTAGWWGHNPHIICDCGRLTFTVIRAITS